MDSVLITKIISTLLYPLGLVVLLSSLALVFRILGHAFKFKLCALFACIILLLSSNPMVARKLAFSLEGQYPQLAIESIAKHDAIIVLGGGLRLPSPPAKHVQLTRGSDRYWYAARLFHAGKAPKILLSGGNIYRQEGLQGEAYYAAQLLKKWGVPEHAIEVELASRTTAENHRYTAKLAQNGEMQSALLVTSAIHMPRAYYLFKQLPIVITPASADVIIRQQSSPVIFNFLPSASALSLSTLAIHEYYGLAFEWLKRIVPSASG